MREVKIKRDGKEYVLTEQEMLKCSEALRINFYIDEIDGFFFDAVPEKDVEDVAEEANVIYERGDGHTEYEALEEAVKQYKTKKKKGVA